MTDRDDQHDQAVVADLVNDPVVPDPDAVCVVKPLHFDAAVRPEIIGEGAEGLVDP